MFSNKNKIIVYVVYYLYFLIVVLTRAASDDSIKIVALTGAGDYFSSGNDLSNFIRPEVCQNVKDSNQLHLFFHGIYTLFSSFFNAFFPLSFSSLRSKT